MISLTWRATRLPLAVLLLAAALQPRTAAADGLNDALIAAYLGDPALKAARAGLRASDVGVTEALGGYRPQVELRGSYNRADTQGGLYREATPSGEAGITESRGGRSSTNRFNTTEETLAVRQNLYAGGGTVASVSRAENEVQAARAQLAGEEQNVLYTAAAAYVGAWTARATLDEAVVNANRLQRQYDATARRRTVGDVSEADEAQAEGALAGALSRLEDGKAAVARSDAAYRRAVGVAVGRLDQPKRLLVLPGTLEQAYAQARTNPSIIRATYELAAAKDAVDVQFARLLPTLDLEAHVTRADDTRTDDVTTRWSKEAGVGVTLTIPLYQQGVAAARVRRAREMLTQSRHSLEQSNRLIDESIAAAWDDLVAATARIALNRRQVRADEVALAGVQNEAAVGTRTVLDMLQTEQTLFEARVQLIQSIGDEVLASYRLKAAVGELNVRALNLAVQPYDPLPHYRDERGGLAGTAPARR